MSYDFTHAIRFKDFTKAVRESSSKFFEANHKMKFKNILYLDDMRTPLILGIDIVRSYNQLVQLLDSGKEYDLISFDHDLALNHYLPEAEWKEQIDYSRFTEKTGLDCAKWVVENKYPLKYWNVHSLNPVGKSNIKNVLRDYCPSGEVEFEIPYRITHEPK